MAPGVATHAEGRSVTGAIREQLKVEGRLAKKERSIRQQVSFGLTEAMRMMRPITGLATWCSFIRMQPASAKANAGRFAAMMPMARYSLQGKGEGGQLPLSKAGHFEVYEKRELRVAVGDRLRITQNGMSADGKHRLINGTLHTVAGFDKRGNIVLDNKQVVAKDFGNLCTATAPPVMPVKARR